MTLALVIPVRDDPVRLDRLLRQAAGMGVFDQVVICDDGSEVSVDPGGAGFAADQVTLIRHARALGPGAARNRALEAVTASHLLYFDSDDLFTDALVHLWRDLAGEEFDFCLFRHHDSRSARRGGWGQIPTDNACWRLAGAGPRALFRPGGAARAALAQTANYPWNKIYRTGFLREAGLRCAEVPLHEDITLHWQSFLNARRVLASDRVAAVHVVEEGGGRMTNRSGAERLCVFEPLAEVAGALERNGGQDGLRLAFFRFAAGLLDWVRAVLDPGLHAAMDARTGAFLKTHLPPDLFERIAAADPVLALRLVLQMAGGRVPEGGVRC